MESLRKTTYNYIPQTVDIAWGDGGGLINSVSISHDTNVDLVGGLDKLHKWDILQFDIYWNTRFILIFNSLQTCSVMAEKVNGNNETF